MITATLSRFAPFTAAVLASLALQPAADLPRYEPKEGTSVERTLEMTGHRELTARKLKVGDKEVEVPGASMTQGIHWKHVILDEYRAVSKGEVKKLARTYKSLEWARKITAKDKEGEDHTVDLPETCKLDGKTIVFTWDAEKKEYVPKFDGEGDDKLLADVVMGMDYAGMLPEEGAVEGAKWKGDFDELRMGLLRPGGDLPFRGDKDPLPVELRTRKAIWDSMKGEIELELGKTSVEDGHSFTSIQFKGKFTADARVEKEEDEKGPDSLHAADEQEFEGVLTWDLSAGRARTLTWSSKGQLSVTSVGPVPTRDGGTATLEDTTNFDEEYEYTVAFETP